MTKAEKEELEKLAKGDDFRAEAARLKLGGLKCSRHSDRADELDRQMGFTASSGPRLDGNKLILGGTQ